MRFDTYVLSNMGYRPGYPEYLELNGAAYDYNTFRKIYKELNAIFNYGINDVKGGSDENWYNTWICMLYRGTRTKRRAYQDVSVCFSWLRASNFRKWYQGNIYRIKEHSTLNKIHLDKDIRYVGNKLYSPNNCLLVPSKINAFFVNNNRFIKSYKSYKGGRYCTGTRDFDTGRTIAIHSEDPIELSLEHARLKDRQLREKVIPYFENLVHPDDRNSPMVVLVLDVLRNYSFEDIQRRNNKFFESVANQVDSLIPPDERTPKKLEDSQDIIMALAEKYALGVKEYNPSIKMDADDTAELLDIMAGVLSKYTHEEAFISKETNDA